MLPGAKSGFLVFKRTTIFFLFQTTIKCNKNENKKNYLHRHTFHGFNEILLSALLFTMQTIYNHKVNKKRRVVAKNIKSNHEYVGLERILGVKQLINVKYRNWL